MARADASIAFNKAFLHCRHGLRPSLAPNINAGAALKVPFNGEKTVTIFGMTKLVSRHVRQRSPPLRL